MSTPIERVSFAVGIDVDAAISSVVASLKEHGVAVLDHLVDPVLIELCLSEIEADYPDFDRVDHERNFGTYKGRHTLPVVVRGSLADPAIFLSHTVGKIAAKLLGVGCQVDSFGLLVSRIGAPDQSSHADATLFPGTGVDKILPPYALAVAMPLVAMDEVSGTTAFWRGSHHRQASGDHDFVPIVQPGSLLVWDFRTHHCGLANNGNRMRLVLFSVVSRGWWVEEHPRIATLYRKFRVGRSVHASLSSEAQYRIHRAELVESAQVPTC